MERSLNSLVSMKIMLEKPVGLENTRLPIYQLWQILDTHFQDQCQNSIGKYDE